LVLFNQIIEQGLTSSFYTHTAFNSYGNDSPKLAYNACEFVEDDLSKFYISDLPVNSI